MQACGKDTLTVLWWGGGGCPDHQADDMRPIETVIATQNMSVRRESNGKGAIFVPS